MGDISIRGHPHGMKVVVDLTGCPRFGFVLMHHASRWAREFGLNPEAIISEMLTRPSNISNRDHMLAVVHKHFGDYVTVLLP